MEDMISRKALCEYALNQKDKSITPNDIMRFPSAQPETHEERTETHGVCLDVIDRQATLDWLKNEWNGMITSLFDGIKALPSAEPETSLMTVKVSIEPEEIERVVRKIKDAPVMVLPSAQPEHTNSWCINSWCINCKEYDTKNKCCPRYNRVIKQTLDEVYAHAETEAEARFHAQQRWIPCSDCERRCDKWEHSKTSRE